MVRWEARKTPSGKPYLYTFSDGQLDAAEAGQLVKLFLPGGEFENMPAIHESTAQTQLSPDARKTLADAMKSSVTPWLQPSALVMHSLVVRVAMGFLMRVSSNPNTKVFSSADDAVKWLEVAQPIKNAAYKR